MKKNLLGFAIVIGLLLFTVLLVYLKPWALKAYGQTTTRPNILLVVLDDQRFDTMEYLPKTSTWMSEGVSYPLAQVVIPSCCPSRSDMFSGRYPHNNGVRLQANGVNLDMTATFTYYLKQAGYKTAMAGKFLNPWPSKSAPPYFDRYSYIKGGYTDFYAYVNGVSKHIVRSDSAPRNYSTIWLGDQLRQYLTEFKADDNTPWFVYYAPQAPHVAAAESADALAIPEPKYTAAPVGTCLQPNETDRTDKPPYVSWISYNAAGYTAVCESQIRTLMSVDDTMDDIMKQLEATGELNNTLIIYTSDNGYLWGEHGRSKKFLPYLPSVKVPFYLRWDGHVTPGTTDNRLASFVDIAPTVLEAAGITVPTGKPALEGQSLLQPSTRTVLYSEYFKDPANGSMPTWSALYFGNAHYIVTYNPTTGGVAFREYYDLTTDPAENENVQKDANPNNNLTSAQLNALDAQINRLRIGSGPAMIE